CLDLGLTRGFWQVGFDYGNLSRFLVGHLLAATLGELLDGILALLDQRAQDLLRFLVVEICHFLDLPVHERSFDHAQGGETRFVARLHGSDDVFLNLIYKGHGGSITTVVGYWLLGKTSSYVVGR